MALYRCEAIFLRVQPFSEADRLATLLTLQHGKVRAIAKGAQKGRGTLAAVAQPFVHARLVLWQGRQLDGISQAELVCHHGHLSRDLAALAAGSYCVDLTDAFTEERQEAPRVFAHLLQALGALEEGGGQAAVVLRWFELQLLRDCGFAPELRTCTACGCALPEPVGRTRISAASGGVLCAECSAQDPAGTWLARNALRALRHLATADAAALGAVRVGPLTMGEMDSALGRHIAGILGRPLKSRPFLDTLS